MKKSAPTPATGLVPTKKIWMDGALIDWKKAHIHVLTHTLHYGSGVFEGVRFYSTSKGPAIFRLKEHTKRLIYSGTALGMRIPYSEKALNDATKAVVAAARIPSGYIRPLAFYGYGKMGLSPVGAPVQVAIACWPWGSYLGGSPIRVTISPYIRIHPKSTVADAKITGHYVNSILSSLEMQQRGFDEALLLDFKGNLAEGPGENLFFIKKNIIYTPRLGSILEGITRNTVMTLARDSGYKVIEGTYTPKHLLAADEAFFTGTAAEIQPIASIDNKKIGTGAEGGITHALRTLYARVVRGEEKKYSSWLTHTA